MAGDGDGAEEMVLLTHLGGEEDGFVSCRLSWNWENGQDVLDPTSSTQPPDFCNGYK